MRLDKYLVELQIGSRSEVKKYIKQKLVSVDGNSNLRPEMHIIPEESVVTFRGQTLSYERYEYYMFHKPAGCVTAHRDSVHATVMDYIDVNRKGLLMVGRLDLDTTGLLLITNDGTLAHQLLSPAKHISKVYEADIKGEVTVQDCIAFRQGLDIGDEKPTKEAMLEILDSGAISKIRVTITEGRYHQVKRMFQAVGKEVLTLKRLQMGGLILDEMLQPGEYRRLTESELQCLKASVGS